MGHNLPQYPDFDLDDPQLPDAIKDAALTSGDFPYDKKLKRKKGEKKLERLQVEMIKLLAWQQKTGRRIVVLFEGRDAAGKSGSIKAICSNLNPRYARTVALAAPSDKEKGEWYFQRYVVQLPTAGEMVLFDRSWYNRGVVEPVMGFCDEREAELFLTEAPRFEHMLVRENIRVFKFWLEIGREMQLKRFHKRRHDPLKVWKISPVDIAAMSKWDSFTKARDRMIASTHKDHAPWIVVKANDKRRAHLALVRYVLSNVEYEGRDMDVIGKIDDKVLGAGPRAL
jgi:polyphosphate kinase 2